MVRVGEVLSSLSSTRHVVVGEYTVVFSRDNIGLKDEWIDTEHKE